MDHHYCASLAGRRYWKLTFLEYKLYSSAGGSAIPL